MPHSTFLALANLRNSMSASFQLRKKEILRELALESPDASPKGYVDDEILSLVNQLNHFDGVVTTSSCAGRVAAFLEGVKRINRTSDGKLNAFQKNEELTVGQNYSSLQEGKSQKETDTQTRFSGIGGKGQGGRWLYVSHKPVEEGLVSWKNLDEAVEESQETCPRSSSSLCTVDENTRLVHFKFEPMVCVQGTKYPVGITAELINPLPSF